MWRGATREQEEEMEVCVVGRPLGDGLWHTVTAERYGNNLLIRVDDGDSWTRRNDSLPTLTTGHTTAGRGRGAGEAPSLVPLETDKHDGVTIGGLPQLEGSKVIEIHQDLQNSEYCYTLSGSMGSTFNYLKNPL